MIFILLESQMHIMNKTKIKILRRADKRDILKHKHVASLARWRSAIKELELQGYLRRLDYGRWRLTSEGALQLQEIDQDGMQTSLAS